MKKTALYIVSFFLFTVYVLSLNRPFMEWWADFRTYKLCAPHARARYGDLYSNCFLPGYMDTAFIPLRTQDSRSNDKTDLYILHDSYLANRLKKDNFQGIRHLVMIDYRAEALHVKPDTAQRNILIIECSERTALWRLSDTVTAFTKLNVEGLLPNEVPQAASGKWKEVLFNPNINQNLEFSLYDYEWFRPIKHLKAQLNFSLFNRLPKEVAVSTDQKYLLLNETVDPASGTSSFIPLDQAFVTYVISCLNQMAAYYKRHGFDEVYFSIIPNPVSIVDQDRMPYNHKIEWVEGHANLQVPPLSVYHIFKQTGLRIYRTDDSHWNGLGLQLWVDEVNKRLEP